MQYGGMTDVLFEIGYRLASQFGGETEHTRKCSPCADVSDWHHLHVVLVWWPYRWWMRPPIIYY